MAAGVIFDCDGVLVDTEVIANRTLASLVTELGIPTTTEESIARYIGCSWTSVISILTEELGAPPREGLLRRNREAVEDAWRRELLPVPGIVEALDRIALPYCVASSGDHDRIRLTLGITGLLSRFEGRIFSATDVANGKPEPDLFLHAAKKMGFDIPRTTVVEDTVPGVQAGKAAEMRVLAYARLVEPDLLAAAGARSSPTWKSSRACSNGQGGQTDSDRLRRCRLRNPRRQGDRGIEPRRTSTMCRFRAPRELVVIRPYW